MQLGSIHEAVLDWRVLSQVRCAMVFERFWSD